MNPTQLERIGAPVIVNSAPDRSYIDPIAGLNNTGIQRLQHDIGDTNRDVKDSEAQIRADLKDAESNIRRDVAKTEADLARDIMGGECNVLKKLGEVECSTIREILETKHSLAKDILKSEYENKLAIQTAIKEINDKAQYNSDRTQDKAAHYYEELREDINDCCCEAKVTTANQIGLLNQLVKGLLK